MLQQTQVARVLQKYPRFIKQFPNFRALASASASTIIKAWQGMGYNNRAIRLRQLATIIEQNGERLPASIEELEQLPGIGKYTAHALTCLAFRKNVAVVDTNVRRVLMRLYPPPSNKVDIWRLAERVLPSRKADIWNQALMDLGSTICVASSPKCTLCPLRRDCPSALRVLRPLDRKSSSEPGRAGIPNRIYRGRVVEILRSLRGNRTIAVSDVGRRIKKRFNTSDRTWMNELMLGLKRDGLVELRLKGRAMRAALPQ